jgi:hypothetical protein
VTQQELLDALAQLYAEVDALHEGFSCPASTECCRFGLTGREPYVTSIELLAIERAVARRGGLPSERKRALPLSGAASSDERTCPLLDRAGRCSVYADRPLGCRTFYCSRATRGPDPRPELRHVLTRLRDLAARHQRGGDAARPLTGALSATKRSPRH